jgi:Transglutaminase-like superfamily
MCILYSTVCAAISMRHVPYGINMPGHFVLGCKLSDDTGSAITNTVVIDAYECGELVQLQVKLQLQQLTDAYTHAQCVIHVIHY